MDDEVPEDSEESLLSGVKSLFTRKKVKKEAIEAEENKTEAKDSAWKGGMNK